MPVPSPAAPAKGRTRPGRCSVVGRSHQRPGRSIAGRAVVAVEGSGHAVDLAVWVDLDADKVVDVNELSWKFSFYKELADHVKEVAAELGVAIVWGGDWTTFKDGPHFELDRRKYP